MAKPPAQANVTTATNKTAAKPSPVKGDIPTNLTKPDLKKPEASAIAVNSSKKANQTEGANQTKAVNATGKTNATKTVNESKSSNATASATKPVEI